MQEPQGTGRRTALQALFNLRRGEAPPVLMAGLFFFCILTALIRRHCC